MSLSMSSVSVSFFSVLCVYVWVVILKVHVTVNVCNDVHVNIVWSCCVCAINSYRNDVILYCAKYSLCRSEYIYIFKDSCLCNISFHGYVISGHLVVCS